MMPAAIWLAVSKRRTRAQNVRRSFCIQCALPRPRCRIYRGATMYAPFRDEIGQISG
jgi:hypothetical protein